MTSHIAHRKKSGIRYVHRTSQSDLCDAINALHSVICLGLEFVLIVDSETCKSHLQCTNITVNTVTGNTTADSKCILLAHDHMWYVVQGTEYGLISAMSSTQNKIVQSEGICLSTHNSPTKKCLH